MLLRYSRYLFMRGSKPLIINVTQAALDEVVPPTVSEEALQEHRHRVSQEFSVVRDLTMDQYRNVLGQKLALAHPLQSIRTLMGRQQVTHRIPSRDGRGSISIAARVRAEYDVVEARAADVVQQGIEEPKWGALQAITTIEEGSEAEDEGNSANSNSRSRSNLTIGKRSFPRRFLCRFSPLSWVLVKRGIRK